ncbi:MAG: Asp-tRNA(Asn)/Glu-tRNA(Gln) amidotransferase subunit GatC [Spirochaetes bacterium]|nr:MAG: Asp-tRNA(Asn)/Glu-tRNA(Gln) amidotransferase subunit GatC [Spirochaetota bacterium]RKX97871.1 MAG: Asp-tRNA(Asn)/Glu-tRNA(Gln) amidotransferase subunit GatC [Spirochaetota bacterium]
MAQVQDEWSITAELARLELDENEELILAREAERMRELFLTMSRADADKPEPTTQAVELNNRIRPDYVDSFNNVESLIEASPEQEDDFFLIPNVL